MTKQAVTPAEATVPATGLAAVRPLPQPQAVVRLFCIPFAGGGASLYHPWARLLPPTVELCALQMPGRETRRGERPLTDFAPTVAHLADAVQPLLDLPYVLFGHSLGALLAFEVARTLRRRGQPQPQRLIVSSRRPPHLPEPFPPMAELPDAEFVAAVQARYGGIPQPILQEPELLALFLPTLRADFSVLESYRYDEEAALACPIDAFSGDEDRIATTAAMRAWERHTTCLFATQQFAGGHFFLQTQRNEVLEVLHGLLRQA